MIKERERERRKRARDKGEGRGKDKEREQGKKWGRVKKTEKKRERLRVCTN